MDTNTVRPAQDAQKGRKIFYGFLIGIAVTGALFLAFSLLRFHRTGTVISVGRIGTQSHHSGVGKNAHDIRGFKADVRVRTKDTGETVTVYYRVGRYEEIPQVGDEIEFSHHALVGNQPYPEMWAVWMGVALLGGDLLVYGGFLICQARKKRKTGAAPPA